MRRRDRALRGSSDRGQVGVGPTGRRDALGLVGSAADWAAVATSDDHTLALWRDGSLWAWGNREYGRLGIDDPTLQDGPTRIRLDARVEAAMSSSTRSTGEWQRWRARASRLMSEALLNAEHGRG